MIHTSVDGLATSSRTGPITSLDEKVWDNPVSPYGKWINLGCRGPREHPRSGFSDEKGNGYLPVEYDPVVVAFSL